MSNDLRLELRARNNILWHLVFDGYASVQEFCKTHNLDPSSVGQLLNLSAKPYKITRGDNVVPTKTAARLAEIAAMSMSELFPLALYSGLIPQRMVTEIPSHRMAQLSAAKHIALPPAQEDKLFLEDVRKVINSTLETLTPKQQQVVRGRFGIGCDEQTQAQIAEQMNISIARVGQIEQTVLRRLRHPTRAKRLLPLLLHSETR
jgi:RNA polymerase sigma factor (sigma-70 family)